MSDDDRARAEKWAKGRNLSLRQSGEAGEMGYRAGAEAARREWAVERARLLDIEAQAKKVLKAHDEWLATQSSDDKAGQRGDT